MPKSLITEDEEIFLKMLHKYKRLVVKTLYNKGVKELLKFLTKIKKKQLMNL